MDFAKKQLEKYGWKEGDGLGKDGNQGLIQAIKPKYKTGKEGMGFDMSKDLVDTWWTRAYTDSLKRIDIKSNQKDEVVVSIPSIDEADLCNDEMAKMRRRMTRANFTDFSKGATLDNGLMQEEKKTSSDSERDSGICTPTSTKQLSDEELFKACGGRTLHKAARFGHKLNGKLARIAAQEAAELLAFQASLPKLNTEETSETIPMKRKKRKRSRSVNTECSVIACITIADEQADSDNLCLPEEVSEDTQTTDTSVNTGKIKKRKSKKKSKAVKVAEELSL